MQNKDALLLVECSWDFFKVCLLVLALRVSSFPRGLGSKNKRSPGWQEKEGELGRGRMREGSYGRIGGNNSGD